ADLLGPDAPGPMGCRLVARPVEKIKPVHLVIQAASALNAKDVGGLFPNNAIPIAPQVPDWKKSNLRVTAAGSNVFRIWLGAPVYGAADYLEWTQPLTNDLDVLRQALQRPYVRMDGDYQQPFQMPIPNFGRMRTVAQLLSQRAQSYLLLGQPEAA